MKKLIILITSLLSISVFAESKYYIEKIDIVTKNSKTETFIHLRSDSDTDELVVNLTKCDPKFDYSKNRMHVVINKSLKCHTKHQMKIIDAYLKDQK